MFTAGLLFALLALSQLVAMDACDACHVNSMGMWVVRLLIVLVLEEACWPAGK